MKQLVRRVIIYSVLFLSATTLLIGGVSYWVFIKMVHRVSYKPERMAMILEERARLHEHYQASDISFTTQDGVKIAGMLLVRPNAQRNILICHGHKSAKEMPRLLIDLFVNDNVLIFDFRAHGQSEGNLTTFGYKEYLDVVAAVQFLNKCHYTAGLPVYGIGVSMGAASLIRAAAHGADFKALILDSTYADLQDQIRESFSNRTGLPRFPFMPIVVWLFEREAGFSLQDFSTCADIAWIRCPILIIHSRSDSIVSFSQAERLVHCAGGKVSVWFVEQAYHGRISKEHPQDYARRVTDFFNAVAG